MKISVFSLCAVAAAVLMAGSTVTHGPHLLPLRRTIGHFRRSLRPTVPTVQSKDWVRNPIDAFVLSKLEARGLKAVARRGPVTLLRRREL